ncbi:protein valois [Lutzomyia longipalpis]|uniref:protein valois n=1 Tax=Lutzomyia longipalpis TaxID=7200 RepID=UPI0024834627|nr:protein valois [Lutzomyia longipalpis]
MASAQKRVNLAQTYRNFNVEVPEKDLVGSTHLPHLNAKEFQLRISDPVQNVTPQEFHESFDVNPSGNVVVAINDYRTRFLVGHFWGFRSIQDYKEQRKHLKITKPVTNTPVNVIRFIQDSLVALGRAGGTVELWSTNESMEGYFLVDQRNQHIGSVLDLDVFRESRSHIVTVDAEACIKIWEVNLVDAICVNTFRNAHGGAIGSVATRPGSDNIFATASRDRSALLWDYRLSTKPASGLYGKHNTSLTAIAWTMDGEKEESSVVKVGDSAGTVLTIDIRKPNEVVQEVSAFRRPVKRINATKGKFAFCGHTNALKMYSNDDSLILEDTSSEDFVRDVAFNAGKVIGLCWDGNVVEKDDV